MIHGKNLLFLLENDKKLPDFEFKGGQLIEISKNLLSLDSLEFSENRGKKS